MADQLKADGWKWVEVQLELNHSAISRFRRQHAPELPLSEEQQAELAELEEERDEVLNRMQEMDDDDGEEIEGQPLYDRIDQIDGRIASIRGNRQAAYTDDMKATCGVVVSIGHTGEREFIYGLLRERMSRKSVKLKLTTPITPLPSRRIGSGNRQDDQLYSSKRSPNTKRLPSLPS